MAARTFREKKKQSRVFFDVICDVYTHVDNREGLERVIENKTNFLGRKTRKFKAAVRQ